MYVKCELLVLRKYFRQKEVLSVAGGCDEISPKDFQ